MFVQKGRGIKKLKMEEKHQKTAKGGQCRRKRRLIQAVAHYCGT